MSAALPSLPRHRSLSQALPSVAPWRWRRGAVALVTLALAACGGGGDGGGGGNRAARTVGPNLAAINPDNPIRCVDGYPVQDPGGGGILFMVSQGQGTCLVLAQLEHNPGGPGVAVSATLKVGPVTGPMRFVRMRNTLSAIVGGEACCSLEQYGEVFTPAPNATTTVPLNFPLTWEPMSAPNPSPVIVQDVIGLEILAPDVPWPGTFPLGGRNDLARTNTIYIPALSAQGLPAPTQNFRGGTFNGFVPSFTYALVPAR